MKIENDIFIKKTPRFELFSQYGFVEIGDKYIYERDFMNDSFHAKIVINKDGTIVGDVIDKMTNEEYFPLRVTADCGAFVNAVRGEYEKILINIADNCYSHSAFTSNQANRIATQIYEKYKCRPDFPWSGDAYKTYGVFRHPENQKWYALIMNVKMSFFDKSSDPSAVADVLNIKIDCSEGEKLRRQNGIYPAYHMNRKHWISIVLDDALTDEEIMRLLEKSYLLTQKKQ